eukprot:jgi/Orpsp1_1/1189418/evm.model.d7180000071903.1
MGLRKKHRQIVCNLIKRSNIDKLKLYLKNNYIVLRLLEYGGNQYNAKYINFLIFAIECNSSFEMIKFIIDECQYETLNFSFKDYGSPLFYSIKIMKFKIADFLINNGADINTRYFINKKIDTKGIFYYLGNNNLFKQNLNKNNENIQSLNERLNYILNNGLDITTNVINELIKYNDDNNNNNYILKFILNKSINYNNYILKYKTRILLKNKKRKEDDIIKEIEDNKVIIINNRTIEIAIENENYEALNIIWSFMNIKNELML